MDDFIAIGNGELKEALTETITCERCGEKHTIEYGSTINEDGTHTPSKLLAFVECQGKLYLAGIEGKRVRR